jgi:pimeloyl-ACP methyl ester carboxylesterase
VEVDALIDTNPRYAGVLSRLLAGSSAARSSWLRTRQDSASMHARAHAGTPLRVCVPRAILRDLRRRLDAVRWPSAVKGEPWADGTDLEFMHRLVAYWRRDFDWRAQERAMNALPHFRAHVGGAGIHFIRVPGRGPSPLPLLLTNGWPSSFLEYRKIIPLLADPAAHGGDARDAFDVVIPSLPGYGFSDPAMTPDVDVGRIASLWHELMADVLGYDRYAVHGSDIGAGVCSLIGLAAPPQLLGIHLASVTSSAIIRYFGDHAAPFTDAEREFLVGFANWMDIEGAYSHLQRTKPQSLAYSLTDSPVGLAAWIVEKLRAWSDCSGDVEQRFSLDDILATTTLYWVTSSIGSSMRLYYEGRLHPRRLVRGERVEVPCGVALFPRDIARPPREWAERAYRVTRWTEMPRGGHFPAHEEPALLASELREFFRPLRCTAPA